MRVKFIWAPEGPLTVAVVILKVEISRGNNSEAVINAPPVYLMESPTCTLRIPGLMAQS